MKSISAMRKEQFGVALLKAGIVKTILKKIIDEAQTIINAAL